MSGPATCPTDRRAFLAHAAAGVLLAARPAGDARVRGANDRIRLGLIGCGGRGKYLFGTIQAVAEKQNAAVTAVCDVWRPARESMAAAVEKASGARPAAFARFADLLHGDTVDAVVIATPDFAHCPALIAAAQAKKDAFCEKPLSRTFAEARAARAAVQESGIVVQLGTQRRSDGRHQAAAKLLRGGVLGTITAIDTAWHDHGPRWQRKFDDVKEADVDWEQYQLGQTERPFDARRYRCWHLFHDYTNGLPGLLGSHLVDAALMLTGDAAPVSAVAHGGTYVWKDGREHADTIECLWEYPGGFLMSFASRLGNSFAVPEVRIHGNAGTFDTQTWKITAAGANPARKVKDEVEVPKGGGEDHMANWLECVRSRKTPNASIEWGYNHAVAACMAAEALRTGRRQVYDAGKQEVSCGA